jgi:hypothetical protein
MWFLTLISILLLAQVPKKPEQPIQPDNPKATTQKVQKQIEPLPTPINSPNSVNGATATPVSNPEQTNTANTYSGPYHSVTYINLACTILIALFTFLTWRVYKAMLRTTKINERAWIVSEPSLIEETKVQGTFQATVQLGNTGKSPAWVTAAGSNGWFAEANNPLPKTPQYNSMKPFTEKGHLLPPKGRMAQGFPFSNAQLASVVKKEADLYIFGYIEYRDIYGDTHIIRYCYHAEPTLDLTNPLPLDFFVGGPDEYFEAT